MVFLPNTCLLYTSESCISVAAVSAEAKRPSYSNYDETVNISAPGGVKSPEELGVYSTLVNNKYGYMNGTSMACPHVSGIAALIISALSLIHIWKCRIGWKHPVAML